MDMSFSSNSLLQLQSELGTSCSGLSEQDYFGSGQGFRGYAAFERFTLVRELNSGATATVYEAVERGTGLADGSGSTHVALKVLNSRPGGGYILPPSIVQQEIDCAKRLDHPNIANLIDVVAHDSSLALVFELVRGPDLLDYIKACHKRVPEQLGLHYFRQLLNAVMHMHSRGIAHRDLKPENCMIDPHSHVLKVIDFGLAAPLEAQLPPGCGTLNTIAPECIVQDGRPAAQDSVAVDVWGLGVTLYIALVGRFPFQDARRPQSDQQQVYNTLKGRLNPLPDRVSPAAKELVLSMLQTDPAKRPRLEQIASHPCLTDRQPMEAAFQFEARVFGGAASMYPFSPSDSTISDQTSDGTEIAQERQTADNLKYMLERYLTTTTAEKHRSNLLGNKLGREVRSSKVKQEQKAKPSGLQQEIVEAALMQEVHAQAAESLDNLTASNVPLHTPQVVSAFSEASQSQDYSSHMPEMPAEQFFGAPGPCESVHDNRDCCLPMGEPESSWQNARSPVKLFTLSHQDIGNSSNAASASGGTPASSCGPSMLSAGLSAGRMSFGQIQTLPSVPEADESEGDGDEDEGTICSSSSYNDHSPVYSRPENTPTGFEHSQQNMMGLSCGFSAMHQDFSQDPGRLSKPERSYLQRIAAEDHRRQAVGRR